MSLEKSWIRCLAMALAASAVVLAGEPPTAEADTEAWSGVDGSRFELSSSSEGYRLEPRQREEPPIPIPREWLAPPDAVAAEENSYVSSFTWDEAVQSFPIGGGRLGIHLSSYEIQASGSAQAAAGRDVFLILEPSSRRLTRGGIDLGVSKSRVRVGGCFSARHHRFLLGDVDGDRRLDLGVLEERVDCDVPEGDEPGDEEGLARHRFLPVWSIAPVRWYVQAEDGWHHQPTLDGRLPTFAFRELPLLGLEKSPVDYVLGLKGGQPLVLSSAPPR